MTPKSLLTIAQHTQAAPALFAAAAQYARLLDAHLETLAVGMDRSQVAYSYVGTGAVMIRSLYDQAIEEAQSIEAAVRKAAAEQPDELRWSVESAVTSVGSVNDLIAYRSRFADLVILSRPYGPGKDDDDVQVLEAALFSGQVPVIVLPDPLPELTQLPKRIVFAWNQSAEAMRALRFALPFLKAAETVSVVIVDPPRHGAERSDPGGALCQMLARHGVRPEVSVLAQTLPNVSEVLARHCTDFDADMLVMGAYGHSRLREAILGGATRSLLETATLPVFMAH